MRRKGGRTRLPKKGKWPPSGTGTTVLTYPRSAPRGTGKAGENGQHSGGVGGSSAWTRPSAPECGDTLKALAGDQRPISSSKTAPGSLSTGSPAGRTPPHGDGSMYSQANVRVESVLRPPTRALPSVIVDTEKVLREADGPTKARDPDASNAWWVERCSPRGAPQNRTVRAGRSPKNTSVTKKQLTSRPDHLWQELWKSMGKHAKLKEKQKWSEEKIHLENARKLRGIYFIDPEDAEFKETIKDARKKLETSVAPAMPCKIMKNCGSGASNKIKNKTCRVFWKLMNPQECAWEIRYRIIMKTILQEKVKIHYSTTIWFTNLFLCLKL